MKAIDGTEEMISYKPSAYYFRKALRESTDVQKIRASGLLVCSELEELKAWVRERGLIPPHFNATREEAVAKGWAFADDHAAPVLDFDSRSG